jgi:hypothetical protein
MNHLPAVQLKRIRTCFTGYGEAYWKPPVFVPAAGGVTVAIVGSVIAVVVSRCQEKSERVRVKMFRVPQLAAVQ